MKTFKQLNKAQKEVARGKFMNLTLQAVVEGAIQFADKDVQSKVDAAWAEMDRMATPWFIGERLMETCREEITAIAEEHAKDALYPSAEEVVMQGVVD